MLKLPKIKSPSPSPELLSVSVTSQKRDEKKVDIPLPELPKRLLHPQSLHLRAQWAELTLLGTERVVGREAVIQQGRQCPAIYLLLKGECRLEWTSLMFAGLIVTFSITVVFKSMVCV
tara:strand:- start:48 stop:401 length:354 start_codon:yes stop_codon:yes gene_type:complete